MHDTMRELKGSQQPPLTLTVLGLLGMLPNVVQGPAIELFSRKGSLVASNVPGPQAPLYLCGQRIAEMHFWVPQSGSIGVGVSILSYAGKVFFGLIADRACIAEPAQVVDRLGPEFERLLLAATVGVLGLEQREHGRRASRRSGSGRKRPPRQAAAADDAEDRGKYLACGLTHCSNRLGFRTIHGLRQSLRTRPTQEFRHGHVPLTHPQDRRLRRAAQAQRSSRRTGPQRSRTRWSKA